MSMWRNASESGLKARIRDSQQANGVWRCWSSSNVQSLYAELDFIQAELKLVNEMKREVLLRNPAYVQYLWG